MPTKKTITRRGRLESRSDDSDIILLFELDNNNMITTYRHTAARRRRNARRHRRRRRRRRRLADTSRFALLVGVSGGGVRKFAGQRGAHRKLHTPTTRRFRRLDLTRLLSSYCDIHRW